MKTKEDIISLFIEKGILSNKTSLIRRPFNWKSKFDEEAQNIFDIFSKNYRTESEAWFCLCRNIELPLCPICKINKVKFTGNTKNGNCGYNTTCENCSANSVPEKINKLKNTCANRTQEQRNKIMQKRKETNKKLHGDENYGLFGSKSFSENLEKKYGNKNYNNPDKNKDTCMKRYGVEYIFQLPDYSQNATIKKIEKYGDACNLTKRYNTCQERYGVNNYFETEQFKVQSKKTMISNSGSIEQSYIDRRIKSEKTKIDKYGDKNYHNIDKFKATIAQKREKFEIENNCISLNVLIQEYGQGFKSLNLEKIYDTSGNAYISKQYLAKIQEYSKQKHNLIATSKTEQEIYNFVCSQYKSNIEHNTFSYLRNLNGNAIELDIYIPELKFGIEYNGVYWHSTIFKPKTYHLYKTEAARKYGIKLLHIFEDKWMENSDYYKTIICQSLLQNFTNILEEKDDYIIGDNSLPLFGQYEILKTTKPQKHTIGKYSYYDCGKIYYRRIKKEIIND